MNMSVFLNIVKPVFCMYKFFSLFLPHLYCVSLPLADLIRIQMYLYSIYLMYHVQRGLSE